MNQNLPDKPVAKREGSNQPHTSLAGRAASGAIVTMVGTGVLAVLQIGVMAILARLVVPSDFGLIGAAMVVVGLSSLFVQIGIGPALVQRKHIEQRHLDVGFTISLVLGVVVGAAVFLSAPLVSDGFQMARLTNVVRALSLGFVLSGPSVVAQSLLVRRLRFGSISLLQVLSYLVGYGVVGVILALMHLGVWALVAASLAQTALAAGSALIVERTRVHLSLRMDAARDLLVFGGGITLAGIAGYFAENVDNMVVARSLGTQALGYYGRAFQFLSTPAQWFGTVFDRVFFPILSVMQDDPDRLAPAHRRSLALIALFTVPVTVPLVILAPEIVRTLLGPTWSPVVLPFQILALGMLPRVSSKLAKSVAKATGAVFSSAWRQTFFAALVLAGAWLGSHRGLPGVSVGVLSATVLNYLLMAQLTLRSTGLSWLEFAKAHANGFATGSVWVALGWPFTHSMRTMKLPDLVVISVASLLLLTSLPALWRIWPDVFLGRDGLWAARILRSRLASGGHRG